MREGTMRAHRTILAASLCLAALACEAKPPPPPLSGAEPPSDKDPGTVRMDIAAVLDDWHDAAAKADEERYFSHFTKNAVFLGTDATERWDVTAFRAYAHPHFEQGRAWTFKSVRRDIVLHADGRIAWFDEDLDTENLGPARGSGVVVFEGGETPSWRIAHYNLAITVPNERFEDVRKAITP